MIRPLPRSLRGTRMVGFGKISQIRTTRLLAFAISLIGLALPIHSAGIPEVGQTVPPNASRTALGGWVCHEGFVKRAQSCVPIASATDSEIRQLLIDRSLASYSGSCACPYNVDRAGRRCGGRSAYSRPNGASPTCYPADASDATVREFRAKYSAP